MRPRCYPCSGSAVRRIRRLLFAPLCLVLLNPPSLSAQFQPPPDARVSPVFRASIAGPAARGATAEHLGLPIGSVDAVTRSTSSSGLSAWLSSVSLEAGFRLSRAGGAKGLSLDAGLAVSLLPLAAGAGATHNAIPLLGWDWTLSDGARGFAEMEPRAVGPGVDSGDATVPSAPFILPLFPLTRALDKRDQRNGSFVSLMRTCFTSLEDVTSARLNLADDTEIFFGLGKAWDYGLLLSLEHHGRD